MNRYHVNPDTGNPNLCSAEEGQCPFGTHTLDRDECYAIYERSRADYTVPRAWKRRRPVAPARLALFSQWVNPCARKRDGLNLSADLAALRGER